MVVAVVAAAAAVVAVVVVVVVVVVVAAGMVAVVVVVVVVVVMVVAVAVVVVVVAVGVVVVVVAVVVRAVVVVVVLMVVEVVDVVVAVAEAAAVSAVVVVVVAVVMVHHLNRRLIERPSTGPPTRPAAYVRACTYVLRTRALPAWLTMRAGGGGAVCVSLHWSTSLAHCVDVGLYLVLLAGLSLHDQQNANVLLQWVHAVCVRVCTSVCTTCERSSVSRPCSGMLEEQANLMLNKPPRTSAASLSLTVLSV